MHYFLVLFFCFSTLVLFSIFHFDNHNITRARQVNCVISVCIGSSPQAGWIPDCPWNSAHSFFYVNDTNQFETIRAHNWTPVWVNFSDTVDIATGPLSMPALGWTPSDIENMQAKYVKIQSHRLLANTGCDQVLYMDSKIDYTKETVAEIFGYEHACITLFRHPWRTYHNAYMQEVMDSYNQPRYLRFKPVIELQMRAHASESLSGVMHLGSTHVTNLRNAEALRFQDSWWNETRMYSIQDQLSLFWQSKLFPRCIASWAPMYGPTNKNFIIRFLNFLLSP
jgi:hypothetical protein